MSLWGCIIRLDLRDTFSGGLLFWEDENMALGTIGVVGGIGWLANRYLSKKKKRQAVADANTIDNLERLHQLKEKGVLTNEEFEELKDRMKAKI